MKYCTYGFLVILLSSPICMNANDQKEDEIVVIQDEHIFADIEDTDFFENFEKYVKEHPIEYHDPSKLELLWDQFTSWLSEKPYVLSIFLKYLDFKDWVMGRSGVEKKQLHDDESQHNAGDMHEDEF